ncbi:hypothetical protein [Streptomyces puniciscabiei]|uniref:hypothetical protein n=1 Tax=Streptomyces puniciscabiei TaxID=164348 RepID=UPI003326DED2
MSRALLPPDSSIPIPASPASRRSELLLSQTGADMTFIGAHLGRQFEFVQSQWMNNGVFFGAGNVKDPVVGSADGETGYTIPRRPVAPLPRFVVTRGGEYCFLPSLSALRWLGDLRD